MKKFKIILNSEKYATLEAIDEEDLYRKIRTGHYGIMSIRANFPEIIKENNIKQIIEEV